DDRARIEHRISFEDRHVLHFKDISLHRCLKNSKVNGLTRTQILGIKLRQAIVESAEPGNFGVQRQTTIIADFAIILMKAESGSLQRVSSEIRLNIFLGYGFVFCILRLGSAGCADEQERQQGSQQS